MNDTNIYSGHSSANSQIRVALFFINLHIIIRPAVNV